MQDEIRQLQATIDAVKELPEKCRERIYDHALRINDDGRMVPPPIGVDGNWVTVGMANKIIRDELDAVLKESE